MKHEYVDQSRAGDHLCYISNLDKLKAHYPGWGITKDLKTTFVEIHDAWSRRKTPEQFQIPRVSVPAGEYAMAQ